LPLALFKRQEFFSAAMSLSKTLAALLLVVIWITAILHVELEGAGLLPEHTHLADLFHHSATSDCAHNETDHAHGFAMHEEIVARSGMSWLGVVLGLAALAPVAFALFGLFGLIGCALRLRTPVVIRSSDTSRPWTHGASTWRFLRRSSADSLAPPLAA
jgi:hypothetical protein